MTDTAYDVKEKVKINMDVPLPKKYSVVYFNDDTTSSLFVAQSLIEFFNYSFDAAIEITNTIHESGSGVVAHGLSHEIAHHLRTLVVSRARNENYPLRVDVQPE